MKKIHSVGRSDLDFTKVVYVGPVAGDDIFKIFVVRLVDGSSIEVYTERDEMHFHMKREDFIDLWKEVVDGIHKA